MERETSTNVLFLDACRDNPLARNLARAMGTRSAEIGRGLAAVESGVGTLISFSTQPGNVALDGAGRNSPFAGALVKHIADLERRPERHPDRRAQRRDAGDAEQAGAVGAFGADGAVLFQSAAPAAAALARRRRRDPARLSEAAEAWAATKDTTSIAVLEAFIARYKDTFYAELARARIEEVKKQQVAAATPATSAARPAEAGNEGASASGPGRSNARHGPAVSRPRRRRGRRGRA